MAKPDQGSKKKLATLSNAESADYSSGWEYYMNNVRADAIRADHYAWREICKKYPRLQKFDGAKP
jgi:hypothetical protein